MDHASNLSAVRPQAPGVPARQSHSPGPELFVVLYWKRTTAHNTFRIQPFAAPASPASWLHPLHRFPSHFPIQLLIASPPRSACTSLCSKTANPPRWVSNAAIYHATSCGYLSCRDSIIGTIEPMQLPNRESLGSVCILTHSRLPPHDRGRGYYRQACRKQLCAWEADRRRGAQVSKTESGRKGNIVRRNEPSSKHVWRLLALPTALEWQNAAIFLRTDNLIENPLLCLWENNQVWKSWGSFPWLSSYQREGRKEEDKLKAGEQREMER